MTENTRKRMTPKDRTAAILSAAITVAAAGGLNNMRLTQVAQEAGCSHALVVQYYATMTQLRRAVVRHAIKNNLWKIIGSAVAAGDPTAAKLDTATQKKALAYLAT